MGVELHGHIASEECVMFSATCNACGYQCDVIELPSDAAISTARMMLERNLTNRGWTFADETTLCPACRIV